jgi:crossover junction endodeoxyribonuclease RusA
VARAVFGNARPTALALAADLLKPLDRRDLEALNGDLEATIEGPKRLELVLPWPDSLNAHYRTAMRTSKAGNRYAGLRLSDKAKTYRNLVSYELYDQGFRGWRAFDARVGLEIVAHAPERTEATMKRAAVRHGGRPRDLDNLLKATLDALIHAEVLPDDRIVDELKIWRGEDRPVGQLAVAILFLQGGAVARAR